MDRAPELVGKGADFYKLARKRHIGLDYAEPDRHNQIAPVDIEMRELEKRTRAKMVRWNVPSRMWDYALVHAAGDFSSRSVTKIGQFTISPT
jgi:hypothetical protein